MRTSVNYIFLAFIFVIGCVLFIGEENLRSGIPTKFRELTLDLTEKATTLFFRADTPELSAASERPMHSPEEVRVSDYVPEQNASRRQEELRQRISLACDGKGQAAVIGDVVTVRFFERGSVPTGPEKADVETVAFERLDLGSSSEIGIDGTASLPMLGRVPLAGRSLACAEAELAAKMFDLLGVEGVVTIGFASRPAVLVDGPVVRPGRYPAGPGMTVDRLIAEAGHLIADAPLHATQLGAMVDRRSELGVSESALALEQVRHEAILSGLPEIQVDAALLGTTRSRLGSGAVEMENRLVAAWHEEEEARRTLDAQRQEDLARRIETLRDTLRTAERELDYLRARRDRLDGLLNSGAVTSEKHEEATVAVLAAERVVLERRDALASAEDDLARIDLETETAASADREERLATARDVEVELSRVRGQIQQLDVRIADLRGSRGTYNYTIERPTPIGPLPIAAVGSTALQPGDLLRIEPAEERVDYPLPRPAESPEARPESRG